MKPLLVLLGMGVLIGGIIIGNQFVDVENYVKPTIVKEEVEVTPDWASDEDAVEAAKAVIRKKELEALVADLDSQMAELQAQKDEAEKELGTY